MHHPTDRITHTTTFVTPVVEHWPEQEIAQWVKLMKDHPCTMSEHSYHGATSRSGALGDTERDLIKPYHTGILQPQLSRLVHQKHAVSKVSTAS